MEKDFKRGFKRDEGSEYSIRSWSEDFTYNSYRATTANRAPDMQIRAALFNRHCNVISLPPSTNALQRIRALGRDRQTRTGKVPSLHFQMTSNCIKLLLLVRVISLRHGSNDDPASLGSRASFRAGKFSFVSIIVWEIFAASPQLCL